MEDAIKIRLVVAFFFFFPKAIATSPLIVWLLKESLEGQRSLCKGILNMVTIHQYFKIFTFVKLFE